MRRTKLVRAAAGVAAAALGVTFLGGGVAMAGPPGTAGQTGEIVIHKYEQPNEIIEAENNGGLLNEEDLDGLKALEGVGFNVAPIVGIDLTKPADWEKLGNIIVTPNADPSVKPALSGVADVSVGGARGQQKTDEDGVTTFSDLPGDLAYVVWESAPLEGTIKVAAPTIVTVPYPSTDGTGDGWMTTVHIYPKNVYAGDNASKNGTVVGNNITWTVDYFISNLGIDEDENQIKYTEFKIVDDVTTDVTITSYDSVKVGETALTSDQVDITKEDNKLTLEITDMDVLNDNLNKTLTWTIEAEAMGSMTTENVAVITVNGASNSVKVEEPEEIKAGAHIVKMAQLRGQDDHVTLNGAEFEIYGKATAWTGDCPATPEAAKTAGFTKAWNHDLISGENEGDEDGKTVPMALAEGTYCVYETVVPAGFKGATEPGKLVVVSEAEPASVEILNVQIGVDDSDLPNLPLTGAQGRVLLAVLAVGLVAVAGGIGLVRRNRMKNVDA